ncbi:MAG TPA: hypothetical protein VNF29_16245 [Candidatus Binataceae bacterium]|nr:hypothetical protein [Candidatus Binataceae bacterium]
MATIDQKTLVALGYARPGVAPSPALSRTEREICAAFKISSATFVGARGSGRGASVNASMAGKARQVIDDAGLKESKSGAFDESATAPMLAQQAADLITSFLRNPEDDDAWDDLATAGAYICAALERSAPPYSDREND